MTKHLFKVGVLLLAAGALGGCETMSQTANSWYGQAKGVFSGGERGFIDRQTGDSISADDAALLSVRVAETLETAAPEESVAWRSPKSGASGWIKAGKRVKERRAITSIRDLGLANAPLSDIVGSPYRATGIANIRSGPGTKHEIVGRLKKGEILTALARVKGVKWLMVGREGQAIGYVYAPLLRPARGAAAAAAAAAMGLRDPRSADADKPGSGEPKAGAEIETLTARTPCRNVLYNLAPEGGDARKYRLRACKAGDGAWQVAPRAIAESDG
ncbi:MAG: SH3 domain-containing protein [Alphaproteobacteria bacterium]